MILPTRVTLTITDEAVIVGGMRVAFGSDDPTSVLSAYLHLIRALRDQKRAPAVALRRDDIERLASYLGLDGTEVLDRLASLMGATVAQRVAIASLFATGAIVLALVVASHVDAQGVAASERSAAVVVVDHAPSAVPAVTSSIVNTVNTGAGATGLLPAVRLTTPATVLPTTAVENRSGCITAPSGPVMNLTIPAISYACPVYAGGQPQIDAGFVTLVTAAGPNPVLATQPGAPGTLWLAAHRASHGAAFADVPGLADGALITVATGGVTATYRVVGRTYVEVRNDQVIDAKGNATAAATWESIIRSDMSGNLAPRLVLQTCEGENFRWMIYADLVT